MHFGPPNCNQSPIVCGSMRPYRAGDRIENQIDPKSARRSNSETCPEFGKDTGRIPEVMPAPRGNMATAVAIGANRVHRCPERALQPADTVRGVAQQPAIARPEQSRVATRTRSVASPAMGMPGPATMAGRHRRKAPARRRDPGPTPAPTGPVRRMPGRVDPATERHRLGAALQPAARRVRSSTARPDEAARRRPVPTMNYWGLTGLRLPSARTDDTIAVHQTVAFDRGLAASPRRRRTSDRSSPAGNSKVFRRDAVAMPQHRQVTLQAAADTPFCPETLIVPPPPVRSAARALVAGAVRGTDNDAGGHGMQSGLRSCPGARRRIRKSAEVSTRPREIIRGACRWAGLRSGMERRIPVRGCAAFCRQIRSHANDAARPRPSRDRAGYRNGGERICAVHGIDAAKERRGDQCRSCIVDLRGRRIMSGVSPALTPPRWPGMTGPGRIGARRPRAAGSTIPHPGVHWPCPGNRPEIAAS